MAAQLVHTPPGVRDLYGLEYARKETVENNIWKTLKRYGYRGIQTPTFEFFDIFSKEKGSVSPNEMYKLIDRDGNTLVLRPDLTPSIARAAAKYYFEEDMPIRLCYKGNTFTSQYRYRGRLSETTQMGAELLGDVTSDADAEMLAMLIDCLRAAGLEQFQVEIGHIGFFQGLLEEAALGAEEAAQLRPLIEEKNDFALEQLLCQWNCPDNIREAFPQLTRQFGSFRQIARARKLSQNPTFQQAADYLEKLYGILQAYGLERYISFDLGMTGNYRYYTGIVFKAYTYDTGEAIATGGRYDKLIAQYGKKSASVGFGIYIDNLLTAMNRQQIDMDTDLFCTILLYERRYKMQAIRFAKALREKGICLQLMKKYEEKSLEDYLSYARRSHIRELFFFEEGPDLFWQICCESGEKEKRTVQEFWTEQKEDACPDRQSVQQDGGRR